MYKHSVTTLSAHLARLENVHGVQELVNQDEQASVTDESRTSTGTSVEDNVYGGDNATRGICLGDIVDFQDIKKGLSVCLDQFEDLLPQEDETSRAQRLVVAICWKKWKKPEIVTQLDLEGAKVGDVVVAVFEKLIHDGYDKCDKIDGEVWIVDLQRGVNVDGKPIYCADLEVR
ncbi:hypothetical protein L227DRAFT_249100 [Lentinus tigrinus ALCF2SS1-6]|uniref:Uncharacterized protein n=1 Tax=Lentinus tigrinus ALCF2SS1-6 TaxID=1328759 RepID=A0A5C2S088_9APHY|nr:hypothetical protein L227DRAFT_249100 [Lentinus tigrinus ALCF2SS1-6]